MHPGTTLLMRWNPLKKIYQVTATITSFVEAESEDDAHHVADRNSSEIIGDLSVRFEVGSSVHSLSEMNALDERGQWDEISSVYGSELSLGKYFDDLAEHYSFDGTKRCALTVDMFDDSVADPAKPGEPASPPFWYEVIARKKAGGHPAWRACTWQACMGADSLVEGAVPNIGLDGKPRWVGMELDKVVVTDAEVEAAKLAYEAETGKCSKCAGSGQENAGWHYKEGNKYRDCKQCGASGKAPVVVV